jgi:ribosomal protein L16 Arg81 hydroxylase
VPTFRGDLASLIHPVSVEEFLGSYWGKKPLYVPRENRDHYKALFSSHDVDDILRFSAPVEGWNDKVKMGLKTKKVNQEILFDRDVPGLDYRMIRKSLNAVSLVLNYLQEDSNRVLHMTRLLERDLHGWINGRVNVNAYLSPGKSYLGCHRDTHDELNIQVEGNKRWRVYEPDVRFPYFGMQMESGYDPNAGRLSIYDKEPVMDIVLDQGEFLYIPRGFWHDPVNIAEEPCFGLTIGIKPLCWLDVLTFAARAAACAHEELRYTLPDRLSLDSPAQAAIPDIIRNLCDKMQDRLSMPDIVSEMQRETSGSDSDPEEIRFPSVEEMEGLCSDSELSRPEDVSWMFEQSYGLLKLRVGKKEIGLRNELKTVMDFIRDATVFTPSELPDDLSGNEKVQLCRFLLNSGAVRFA